jgi:plastocyanin
VRNPVRLGGFSAGRRWMTIVAMLAIGSVLLAACGGDDDEDETPTPQPAVSTPTPAAAESPELEPTEAESPAASPVTSPEASPTEVVPPVTSPVTSPEASPTEVVPPVTSPEASPTEVVPPPVTSPEASPMMAASPTEVVPPPVTSPEASPTEEASPGASPEASPMGSPSPAAGAPSIKLLDIRFDPKDVTIAADTDVQVTLSNEGVAPHNFSIDELGIDVDVQPGDEAVVLINAPAGEYKFYCNVPGHEAAGMVGTLTVE